MTPADLDAWVTRDRYGQALAVALKWTDSYQDAKDALQQALERMSRQCAEDPALIEDGTKDKMAPWPWLVSAIRSAAFSARQGAARRAKLAQAVRRAKLAQNTFASDFISVASEHQSSHYAGPMGLGTYTLRPGGPCRTHGGVRTTQQLEAGYDLLYPSGTYVPYVLLVHACLNGGRKYEDASHLLGPRAPRDRHAGPNAFTLVVDKHLARSLGVRP